MSEANVYHLPLTGWICPKCGRGLAPWVASCPCSGCHPERFYPITPVSPPPTWVPPFGPTSTGDPLPPHLPQTICKSP